MNNQYLAVSDLHKRSAAVSIPTYPNAPTNERPTLLPPGPWDEPHKLLITGVSENGWFLTKKWLGLLL